MLKNLLLSTLTFFYFAGRGQFIATYSFAAVSQTSGVTDPDAPPVVPGTIFTSFKAVGVSANSAAGGRFAFTGWPGGGIDAVDTYSLFTGAPSGLQYYEVSVFVLPTFSLSLHTITFNMRRSGTGARNFAVRSSRDNFSANLAAGTGTNTKVSVMPVDVFFWKYDSVSTGSDQRGNVVTLPAIFQNMTDTVTFRFYAWNAEAGGGSFSIDNVSFKGAVKDTSSAGDPLGLEVPRSQGGLLLRRSCDQSGNIFLETSSEVIRAEVITADGRIIDCQNYFENKYISGIALDKPGIYCLRLYTAAGCETIKMLLGN